MDLSISKKCGFNELNGYIQDLEGSAIANILRNAAGQTVIPHIAANHRRHSVSGKVAYTSDKSKSVSHTCREQG